MPVGRSVENKGVISALALIIAIPAVTLAELKAKATVYLLIPSDDLAESLARDVKGFAG